MPVYYSTGLIAGDGAILQAPTADGSNGQALTTNGSGQLAFADVGGGDITGTTAGAPSPAVDGDADTGLFSDTADTLSLAVGGVEGLRIEESAGDVTWVGSIPLLDATHTDSLAIGYGASIGNASATGRMTAIGVGATAGNQSWQSNATAIGYGASAVHNQTIAIGSGASASGTSAIAIGAGASSSGGIVLGVGSASNGAQGSWAAAGSSTSADARDAFAMGWGVTTSTECEFVYGSRIEAAMTPSFRLAGSTTQFTGRDLFRLATAWADVTDGTRKSRATFNVYDTAVRESLRIEASGTAPMIGFLGASAVVQQSGTGETTGFTAGSGTGVNDDSTFTGNVGSTGYTMSDVVKALKNYGLLAS